MYLNVPIAKKSFEILRGRNLHLAKSKKCERGSENERPADTESTSTVTDNNLHCSNTSRLSMVTKENTARISFYQNTSSDEFGTGSSHNQSTDDQCVPGQLPFYNSQSTGSRKMG